MTRPVGHTFIRNLAGVGLRRWLVVLVVTLWPAAGNVASAQQPSQAEWRYYVELLEAQNRASNQGEADATGEAADRVRAFVEQRFPKRLHFLGIAQVATARQLQARYQESIDLYQEVLKACQDFKPTTDLESKLTGPVLNNAYRDTAYCLARLGRYEEAVPYMKQCVKTVERIAPNNLQLKGETLAAFAYLQIDLDDYATAEAMFREAIGCYEQATAREPDKRVRFGAGLAHALSGLAKVHIERGRYDLAEPILRRALTLAVDARGWKSTAAADVCSWLGLVYSMQGMTADALAYQTAALEIWEAIMGKDHPLTMVALHRMAILRGEIDGPKAAEPLRRRMLEVKTAQLGRDHPDTIDAQATLGMVLLEMEQYDEAEALLTDALKRQEARRPLQAKLGLGALAILKTKRGQPDEALKLLDRLAEIHQHYPADPTDSAHLHASRAQALWDIGKRDDAVAEMLKSVEFIEKQRGFSLGADRERATLMGNFSAQFETLVDWQAELGNYPGMFLASEGAKARTFLDELRLKQIDPSAGLSAEQRTQYRQREDQLRRELAQAEKAQEAIGGADTKGKAEAAGQEKAARAVADARSALYQFLGDVRAASPAYKRLITDREQPTTLADLQATLADDELLLEYTTGNWFPSYVMVIRRDSVTATKLVINDAAAKALGVEPGPLKSDVLAQLLTDEKTGVLPVLSSPQRKEDISEKLAALWAVLVPQAERAALTDGQIKKLVVVPDRSLALLPFETLVVATNPKPEYLLDAGPPISYAPSASILVNLTKRERGAVRAAQRAFTLGDPAYLAQAAVSRPQNDTRSSAARAADQFRSGLTRLPFSGWEAVWVNKNFTDAGAKAVKVTGAQATEAAIRKFATQSEIVHLACHGIVDLGYGNFFGSLAVAPGGKGDPRDDGFLSMSEIYDLDLSNCQLAILSACDTNYGPQQTGEGVWALSRGFLVAGARRVVASNWLVDDEAGATLVHHFTAAFAKTGEDPTPSDYATALQAAKRKVRKQERWAHPFYWSSLVLMGAR